VHRAVLSYRISMIRRTYSSHYSLTCLCGVLLFLCPVAHPQNITLRWPGAPESKSNAASASPAKPADPKQPAKPAARPLDGSVSGNIYTNNFFGFSLSFPRTWKILPRDDRGSPGSPGTAYLLFWAGTQVGETHATRGMMIATIRPDPNTPLAGMSTEEFAQRGSAVFSAFASMYPEAAKNMEPFKLVSIGGGRLAQTQMDFPKNDETKNDGHGVFLAMSDRGYLLVFFCVDPLGHQSDPDAAARTINSLHFFGKAN